MSGRVEWRARARALAQALTDAGVLDPQWWPAFADTPRHVFVPRFYRDDDAIIDGEDPHLRGAWLDAVYADTSLVTKHVMAPGTNLMWPTSSSTKPSLMAYMLRLLDVADDHQVAEIGTGTGYHAALLCHRLGHHQVASIDVDPEAVESARKVLATLGLFPYLAVGDGGGGVPQREPYDRLIATCAVSTIPTAWIRQLRLGGVMVTDLRGEVASSLFTARKTAADTVTGRFDATAGNFMWLRAEAANPLRDGGAVSGSVRRDGQQVTHSRLDPALLNNPNLRFLIQMRHPDLAYLWPTTRDNLPVVAVATTDDWAEISTSTGHDGARRVTYGGPNNLWETVEETVRLWRQLGCPTRNRFGLTVTPDRKWVWLDHPDQPVPAVQG